VVAVAGGALAAVYGFGLIAEPFRILELLDVFKPVVGVTLVFIGVMIAAQSLRLLQSPHRPYLAGDPSRARAGFVVLWLLGSLVIGGNAMANPAQLKFSLMILTVVSLFVAGAGALWLVRGYGAKMESEWRPLDTAGAVRRRTSAWSVFFAFLWGIVGAVIAIRLELGLVELAAPFIDLGGDVSAQDLLSDPAIMALLVLGVVLVAPIIEELSKAMGLRLFRSAIGAHGDGLLLGLCAGLGFAFIESAGYILGGAGSAIVFVLVWLRVATMFMHSLTTGLIGAGYAWARLAGDARALWNGVARAIGVHAAWNGGVVVVVLFGAVGGLCLALVLIGLLIGLAVWAMPRIATASIERSIQDDHALAGVALPDTWSPIAVGAWWRIASGRPEYPTKKTDGSPY
jgi:RsiW-degrading membrane proteinase PrsW (M82 family)